METLKPPRLLQPLERMCVTSPFGMRDCPITGKRAGHVGVDLRAPIGTPVYAAADGVVAASFTSRGNPAKGLRAYGNVVYLDHAHGWSTRYAHLANRMVRDGEEVRAGQLIGFSGETGDCAGPHLHWELRLDGAPHDPMPYVVHTVAKEAAHG